MQVSRLAPADADAKPQRVQAGAEQRLVRIDVAESAQEFLVQEHRFEPRLAGGDARGEFVRPYLQRVGTQRGQARGQPLGPLPAAELADVLEHQPDAAVQGHRRPRVLSGSTVEQQVPGHPQVND